MDEIAVEETFSASRYGLKGLITEGHMNPITKRAYVWRVPMGISSEVGGNALYGALGTSNFIP